MVQALEQISLESVMCVGLGCDPLPSKLSRHSNKLSKAPLTAIGSHLKRSRHGPRYRQFVAYGCTKSAALVIERRL